MLYEWKIYTYNTLPELKDKLNDIEYEGEDVFKVFKDNDVYVILVRSRVSI